jgi:hypothetical protein
MAREADRKLTGASWLALFLRLKMRLALGVLYRVRHALGKVAGEALIEG